MGWVLDYDNVGLHMALALHSFAWKSQSVLYRGLWDIGFDVAYM